MLEAKNKTKQKSFKMTTRPSYFSFAGISLKANPMWD